MSELIMLVEKCSLIVACVSENMDSVIYMQDAEIEGKAIAAEEHDYLFSIQFNLQT